VAEVGHRLRELLEAAGIDRVKFHSLRHSCASFLLAKGVPMKMVQEILGHAVIGTTMNLYTHILPSLR